jgi:hypothetical protein
MLTQRVTAIKSHVNRRMMKMQERSRSGQSGLVCCSETHSLNFILQDEMKFAHKFSVLIAVAARSKARTVFARSKTAIVGSNPT